MAKLPALIDAIAKVDGRDRATIEHVARVIRETGYIPTTKRGAGASNMTAREAANLLLALNGADTPKEGPLAIDRFRSLLQYCVVGQGVTPQWVSDDEAFAELPAPLRNVAESRTFGEALEELITGAPELAACLFEYAKAQYGEERAKIVAFGSLGIVGVNVTLHRYGATIALFRSVGSERLIDFETNFIQDMARVEAGFYGRGDSDRKISVAFGIKTLLQAHSAILDSLEDE